MPLLWAIREIDGLTFVGLALWLVPWDWVPGGDLRPMPAQDLFTPAEIARAGEATSDEAAGGGVSAPPLDQDPLF